MEELTDYKYVESELTLPLSAESPSLRAKMCVNCEVVLEKDEDQVTEFLVVFSDCERNVSLAEALGSVFAITKLTKVAGADSPLPILHMCIKCAEILNTLYKAYVELMEQSKATAYLTRIVRQVLLWHLQHGHTFPNDFSHDSKEESVYRYLNSVLALELADSEGDARRVRGDEFEEEDETLSEDDIPISTRMSYKCKDSQLSVDNINLRDDEEVFYSSRKIRAAPKKRKITDSNDEDEDDSFEDEDDDWSEEFERRSKTVSRRKSTSAVKRPTIGDLDNNGPGFNMILRTDLEEKPIRRRGRPPKNKEAAAIPKKGVKGRSTRLQGSRTEDGIHDELILDTESSEDKSEFVVPSIGTRTSDTYFKAKGKAHVVKVPKIKCPQCDTKFIYNWMLENHILAFHEGKPALVCEKCDLHFFKEDLMEKHTCIPKEMQEAEKKKRPHTCVQCGKTFLLLKHVKQHYKCHDEDKPFQCSQCPSSFKSENFLRFHEKLHTEDKSWQCSICGKVFHVKRNLTIHMDIHEVEKKYLCSQCGEKFAQQKALRRHISAQHEPTLKHKCPICGKGFKRKDHITQHLSSKVHPKSAALLEGKGNAPTVKISEEVKVEADVQANNQIITTSTSPQFVRQDNSTSTHVLHLQPALLTNPNLFHPVPHSHFLAPPNQNAQNPRSGTEFAFSDYISFE